MPKIIVTRSLETLGKCSRNAREEALIEIPELEKSEIRKSEHAHQSEVFRFLRSVLPNYGRRAFSVPNQRRLSGNASQRAAQWSRLHAEGVEPGVPDFQVPGPPPLLPGCAGVVVELKPAHGSLRDVTAAQWSWLAYYAGIGWVSRACVGDLEAIRLLEAVGYRGRSPWTIR
jgi:hypothetical protein